MALADNYPFRHNGPENGQDALDCEGDCERPRDEDINEAYAVPSRSEYVDVSEVDL